MTFWIALFLMIAGVALLRRAWWLDRNCAESFIDAALNAIAGGALVILSLCAFAIAAIIKALS